MASGSELMTWEQEVLANHRWGQHGDDQATEERARLRELWSAAELSPEQVEIAHQIVGLEICNWNLEGSFLDLCRAIGSRQPHSRPIGHMGWLSPERWERIWAYYASIRDWISPRKNNAYRPLRRDAVYGTAAASFPTTARPPSGLTSQASAVAASSCEVHCGQRVAVRGIVDRQ